MTVSAGPPCVRHRIGTSSADSLLSKYETDSSDKAAMGVRETGWKSCTDVEVESSCCDGVISSNGLTENGLVLIRLPPNIAPKAPAWHVTAINSSVRQGYTTVDK